MKVIHMHPTGETDPTSQITIDPERLPELGHEDVPERMLAGVVARWDAVQEGQCTCGAGLVRLTRKQRRDPKLWGRGMRPNFDAYLMHQPRCLAMDLRVRGWIYENLRNCS